MIDPRRPQSNDSVGHRRTSRRPVAARRSVRSPTCRQIDEPSRAGTASPAGVASRRFAASPSSDIRNSGGNVASCVVGSSRSIAVSARNSVDDSVQRRAGFDGNASRCSAIQRIQPPPPRAPPRDRWPPVLRARAKYRSTSAVVGCERASSATVVDRNQSRQPPFAGSNCSARIAIPNALSAIHRQANSSKSTSPQRRLHRRFCEQEARPLQCPATQRHESRPLAARPKSRQPIGRVRGCVAAAASSLRGRLDEQFPYAAR